MSQVTFLRMSFSSQALRPALQPVFELVVSQERNCKVEVTQERNCQVEVTP